VTTLEVLPDGRKRARCAVACQRDGTRVLP
jgi:hypothetical protein